MNNTMETKHYIVARIDGDYAWLNRTDMEEIDEGTKLKYELLQHEIL